MIALHNKELSILFHFVDSNCTVYNFGISIVLSLGLPTVYRGGGGIIGQSEWGNAPGISGPTSQKRTKKYWTKVCSMMRMQFFLNQDNPTNGGETGGWGQNWHNRTP